ncbi:hypothetical protein J6590_095124 [Homalodisca vitripennis]|nr:hypothetical protein J6590_095124 [Homalodisca vitripennis]
MNNSKSISKFFRDNVRTGRHAEGTDFLAHDGRPYAVVNTPTLVPPLTGNRLGTYHRSHLDQLIYRSNQQTMSTHRV